MDTNKVTIHKMETVKFDQDKLNAYADKKPKCYNCKFASKAFKLGDKTHHQCNHPKHEEGFENGTLTAWDTLQEWWWSCQSHEFKDIE